MQADPRLKMTVLGDPVGQGRMTSFVVKGKKGPRGVVVAANKGGLERWRGDIRQAALAILPEDYVPTAGPVIVRAEFRFRRPRSHYLPVTRTRLVPELRLDAPRWVTTDPDTDKLERALGDALTDVVYTDDRLIVKWVAQKVYNDPPGVYIEVLDA